MKKAAMLLALFAVLMATSVPGAIAAWYLEWDPSIYYATTDNSVVPIPAGKIVTYRVYQDNVLIANGITATSVLLANLGVGVPHVFEYDGKVDNVYGPKARLDWTSPLVGPAVGNPRAVQR